MALPQHDKAAVQFFIHTGGGVSRTIQFGKTGQLSRVVFGAVDDTAATDDDFPHAVVALNVDTAATEEVADISACAVDTPRPSPYASFTVEGNSVFKDSWVKLVRNQDRRNRPIKMPLGVVCPVVSFYGVILLFVILLRSPLTLMVSQITNLIIGAAFTAYFAWRSRAAFVCAGSRRLAKIGRFVVWVTLCVYFTFFMGHIFLMTFVDGGLFLVIDLLLACCGIRPTTANWPFYRRLGLQGAKVPTLTLTVRPNRESSCDDEPTV